MTKKLNPNEAPTGYAAVAGSLLCKGCAFDALESCHVERTGHECTKRNRKDGHSVIFIKRPEPAPLDTRYTLRLPAFVKAKAQRIGAAAVIAAIEAAEEGGVE